MNSTPVPCNIAERYIDGPFLVVVHNKRPFRNSLRNDCPAACRTVVVKYLYPVVVLNVDLCRIRFADPDYRSPLPRVSINRLSLHDEWMVHLLCGVIRFSVRVLSVMCNLSFTLLISCLDKGGL